MLKINLTPPPVPYSDDGMQATFNPEAGDKLIITGEGVLSGELIPVDELSDFGGQTTVFSGELKVSSDEVAAKIANGQIFLTATYGEALEGVKSSTSGLKSLIETCKPLYKSVFASNAQSITLTDQTAYLAVTLPTDEKSVYINGVECELSDGKVWVAIDASNKIQSARLSLFNQDVKPGQLYNVTRGESTFKNAAFTINTDGDKVIFSPGNLMYQASSNKWEFAARQWDYVGDADGNSASANRDKNVAYIDLFGWGTWLEGGNPTNISKDKSEYSWNASKESAIGSEWFTLSKAEWNYIINERENLEEDAIRYSKAKIHGIQGLILLPDGWKGALKNYNTSNASFEEISDEEWANLENEGAVFLPAAGYREGSNVNVSGSHGLYWSLSLDNDDPNYAYGLDFYVYVWTGELDLYHGVSVRLVRHVDPDE